MSTFNIIINHSTFRCLVVLAVKKPLFSIGLTTVSRVSHMISHMSHSHTNMTVLLLTIYTKKPSEI